MAPSSLFVRQVLAFLCFVGCLGLIFTSRSTWAVGHVPFDDSGFPSVSVGGGSDAVILQALAGALALSAFIAVSLGRSVDYVFASVLSLTMVLLVSHIGSSQLHLALTREHIAAQVAGIYATHATGQEHSTELAVLVLVVCIVGLIAQIVGPILTYSNSRYPTSTS